MHELPHGVLPRAKEADKEAVYSIVRLPILIGLLLSLMLSGCVALFPKYCDEQVRFEFRLPEIAGLERGSAHPLLQDRVPVNTQYHVYTGLLTDTIAFGTTNRRKSYCIFNSLPDSLLVLADHAASYVLNDSVLKTDHSYFPVYFFNQGPGQFLYQHHHASIKYQVKTSLGWMNVDRFIDPGLMHCGSEINYQSNLIPGEVLVLLFAKRDGPDLVESRVCIEQACSDIFPSRVDLSSLLPIQTNVEIQVRE